MLWMDASSRALYTVSDCWGDSPSTRALGVPRPYFMAIVLSLIATLAIAITCRVPRYRDAPFPVAERIKPE